MVVFILQITKSWLKDFDILKFKFELDNVKQKESLHTFFFKVGKAFLHLFSCTHLLHPLTDVSIIEELKEMNRVDFQH